MSGVIITLFIYTGEYNNLSMLYGYGRMWGAEYIPGWPNGVPVPLLFALWFGYINDYSRVYRLLIITALILTTSRGGLLGAASIVVYFQLKKTRQNPKRILLILGLALLWLVIIGDVSNWLLESIPSFSHRMGMVNDRKDIFQVSKEFFMHRPLTGYGGNSLDQLTEIYGNFSKYGVAWPHTHNWVLDILLRYGLIGLLFYFAYMISILVNMKDEDRKFMFLLMLVLSLFQTFMRNFNVIFLLKYLTMEKETTKMTGFGNNKQCENYSEISELAVERDCSS